MATDREIVAAVRRSLSPGRVSTYELAANITADDDLRGLVLYAWNAEVSGALLPVLHVCEVVVRNAVSDALTAQYGAAWPWSPGFEQSLPSPANGYNARHDLQRARDKRTAVGKVIPELNMMFWQQMFTQRHDQRLWFPNLRNVLPHLEPAISVKNHREALYRKVQQIRSLRNRIAHHEPVFARSLVDDLRVALVLIGYRCPITLSWVAAYETATAVVAARPS